MKNFTVLLVLLAMLCLNLSLISQGNLLYLKKGDPSTWTVQNGYGSQYKEITEWQAAGYTVETEDFSAITLTSSLLEDYDVLRINGNYGRAISSSEGDALYDWVNNGGKLLAVIRTTNQVPGVSPFGVDNIEGQGGGSSGLSWYFHGAPFIVGPVTGPETGVDNIGIEVMDHPVLNTNHDLIIDATISGYPAVTHNQFGDGKAIIIFCSGWSHDRTHPGNAYRSDINKADNLEFLNNCIEYLSDSPNIDIFIEPAYSEWSGSSEIYKTNQFVCQIRLTNNDSRHYEDVSVEALLDDSEIYSNIINLNANSQTTFKVCSDPQSNNIVNENLILKITIPSIERTPIVIQNYANISMYFANNETNSTFEFNQDRYYFENPDSMTLDEWIFTLKGFGIDPARVALILVADILGKFNGRCYGMATSSGSYFLYPNYKPIQGLNTYSYPEDNNIVLDNINRYHLGQIENVFIPYNSNYTNLKNQLLDGNPIIMDIKRSGKRIGHSVLVTKITEIDDIAAIYVYDSNIPDMPSEAVQSINDEEFTYLNYWDKYRKIGMRAFDNPDPIILIRSYLNDLSTNLFAENKKVFTIACPANLLVTNSDGLRTGFDDLDIRYDEIPASEIIRFEADPLTADSATIIYVPKDGNYNVEFFGVDDGNMRFEYYEPIDASHLSIALKNEIVITRQTKMFFDDIDPTHIKVDFDGDGNIDYNVPLILNVTGLTITSISATPLTICSGEEVQLETEVYGENYTYSWTSDPAGFTSVEASPIVYPTVSTTYSLTVSDEVATDSKSVFVEVNPLPNANAGDDEIIYNGYPPEEVQLNATGGTQYSWTPTDGLSDATIASPIAEPEVSTTYTVTVTDENGCVNTDEVFVEVIDVRCGNNNNKVLVCKVPPGNPDNEHTICVSPNAVPALLANGSYLGPCDSDKSAEVGYDELLINIYPNPFKNETNIDLTILLTEHYNITITDQLGRLIYVIHDGELSEGEHKFKWTIEKNGTNQIKKGLYLLNVYNNSNFYTRKLIIK